MQQGLATAGAGRGSRHAVFVYGTLKQGFFNHKHVLLPPGPAGAAFVQPARTHLRYPLFVDYYAVPYLVNRPDTGQRIVGELFSVDDSTLAALDVLEGVAKGIYERRVIDIELLGEPPAAAGAHLAELRCLGTAAAAPTPPTAAQSTSAWLYCIRDVPEIELERRGELLGEYSAEVHTGYVKQADRDESLRRPWGGFEAAVVAAAPEPAAGAAR